MYGLCGECFDKISDTCYVCTRKQDEATAKKGVQDEGLETKQTDTGDEEKDDEGVEKEDAQGQDEVEDILSVRRRSGHASMYHVKWVGHKKPTWETEANIPQTVRDHFLPPAKKGSRKTTSPSKAQKAKQTVSPGKSRKATHKA